MTSNLLHKKPRIEGERGAYSLNLDDLDTEIIRARSGLRNRNNPILALPVEVTSLIFCETFSTISLIKSEDPDYPNHYAFQLMEVDISHVCRRWRSIAISLPILWTSFYYFGSKASTATIDRLEVYLKRSKTRLLELCFDFRGTNAREEALHRDALEKAIMHVDRWRLLSIFSSSESESKFFWNRKVLSLLRTLHAPNLEHFTFYPRVNYKLLMLIAQSSEFRYRRSALSAQDSGLRDHTLATNLQPSIFTEGTPKLRSVLMETTIPILYRPPLFNVTTLRIEFGSDSLKTIIPMAFFLALLDIPTLENFSMHDMVFMEHPPSYRPIHMNRLKHLRLGRNLLCTMLPDLHAPLLETLAIYNGLIEREFYANAHRWGEPFPSLKTVALIDVACENRLAMRCFSRMTRNATQVTIAQRGHGKGILQAIDDLPEKEEGFWPNLRTLICDIETSNDLDFAVLLRIARCCHERGLALKMPMAQAAQWKMLSPPQATYEMVSSLCTIEELVADNLRDQGPWPPGEENTLDRRLDFYDPDPFRTDISQWGPRGNHIIYLPQT